MDLKDLNRKPHNFKIPKNPRIKVALGKRLWRCEDCDSEVVYPIHLTQAEVNRLMQLRIACVNAQMFKA